jgi:hypothetical protein
MLPQGCSGGALCWSRSPLAGTATGPCSLHSKRSSPPWVLYRVRQILSVAKADPRSRASAWSKWR